MTEVSVKILCGIIFQSSIMILCYQDTKMASIFTMNIMKLIQLLQK